MTARFMRASCALWILTLCAQCSPTSQRPPTTKSSADVHTIPARDNAVVYGLATDYTRRAVNQAREKTLPSTPAITLAGYTETGARKICQTTQNVRLNQAMPFAIHEATQTIHMARWASAIPTAFHKPSGRARPRHIRRAKRRRIKPGYISVRYAKGGLNTKIRLYDQNGNMRPEAYIKLTRALFAPGDTRLGHNAWVAYHPRVFAMLYRVGQHFQRRVEIISAFRVPRRRKKASSNHHRGRAIDFRFKSIPRSVLRNYLDETFNPAGIGWYPNSSFVHMDTRGRSYWWTDTSRPGQRQRIRARKPRKKKRKHDETYKSIHMSHKRMYSRM